MEIPGLSNLDSLQIEAKGSLSITPIILYFNKLETYIKKKRNINLGHNIHLFYNNILSRSYIMGVNLILGCGFFGVVAKFGGINRGMFEQVVNNFQIKALINISILLTMPFNHNVQTMENMNQQTKYLFQNYRSIFKLITIFTISMTKLLNR